VIDRLDSSLGNLTYRLGYQLVKEYKRGLLFRSGCAGNGPCDFFLIDKNTGKTLKEFGELIYDRNKDKFYDFVLYFISPSKIGVYYIDSRRRFTIPVRSEDFIAVNIPEYAISVRLVGSRLSLEYNDRDGKKRVVSIDLKKGA
jgi:hypothetical protein